MSIVQLGVGTHPIRMDLMMRAGEPFSQLIPVADGAGLVLDQTAWTVTHAVLTVDRSQTLGTLTVVHDVLGLTLSATKTQTTAWASHVAHVLPLVPAVRTPLRRALVQCRRLGQSLPISSPQAPRFPERFHDDSRPQRDA
jgi:hypothetical protein